MEIAQNFIYFLAAIGAIYFLSFCARIIWSLLKLCLIPQDFHEIYGSNCWVVVTGGSDGIGLGFCEQFAKLGYNICIISRNQNKCKQAQNKIKIINSNIETRIIVANFTECQKQGFFQQIMQQLKELDIGFLVNNVGISNIGYLHQIPYKRLLNQININIIPMTVMSNLIIEKMLTRNKKSAIINLSSIAGKFPTPYISTYAATKAYNDFFSKGIGMQYQDKIDILSVQPMKVESNLSKTTTQQALVITRNDCARSTLNHLGLQYQTAGHWKHRFVSYIVGLLPTILTRVMFKNETYKLMQKQKKN